MACIDTINELRESYERKYGFAVFDLSVEETVDKVIVRGQVLTPNQKNAVLDALERSCGKPVEGKVEVLSESGAEPQRWATVKAPLIDLKSRYVPSALQSEKMLSRIRATQALRGEVLRVLLEKDGQFLVQTDDMAMGWAEGKDVELSAAFSEMDWRSGIPAKVDDLIMVKGSSCRAVEAAEKHMGARYVLGAKSPGAIDCSGLTQLAYRDAFGIILPRHSWDQKKMGITVSIDLARDGDLVFMVNGKTGVKHVGMIELAPSGRNIIHACLTEGGVVKQSAEEALRRYELVEVRRIIKNNS
jgi:hypothetical protein